MLQIGRKIYYEKLTGNVIIDLGERMGSVVETTTEQDFAMYTKLQQYMPEQVGCMQLMYGQYAQQFTTCYGYRVDITKELVGLVFVAIPPEATLGEAQTAKISSLTAKCNEETLAGFYSDPKITGTPILFGYDEVDQKNMRGMLQSIALGFVTEPILWKAKGDAPFDGYTIEQFKIIGKDAYNHELSKTMKLGQLSAQVKACVSVAEIEGIEW